MIYCWTSKVLLASLNIMNYILCQANLSKTIFQTENDVVNDKSYSDILYVSRMIQRGTGVP